MSMSLANDVHKAVWLNLAALLFTEWGPSLG